MDERPAFVDDAQSIRVAVGGKAKVAPAVRHEGGQGDQRGRVGGGELAAEEGVVAVVDHLELASAGHEDGPEAGLAHPVHGVQGDLEPGVLDGLRVDHGQDAVDVFVGRGVLPDQALTKGVVIVHRADGGRVHLGDLRFQPVGDGLVRVPPAAGEHLDPVVDGGVMAGGDHGPVGHAVGLHREHDEGRGAGSVDHQHPIAVPRQNFRQPVGRFLGQEPPIVPQADLSAPVPFLVHEAAEARGQQLQICLGEFVSDDGAPAARSEMDHVMPPCVP